MQVYWAERKIDQCIRLSIADMQKNESMMIATAYFWSDTTNTFMFGHGPATPTLADVYMLTGLDTSTADEGSIYGRKSEYRVNTRNIGSWTGYIQEYRRTGTVNQREHATFLNMWLEKFIFCGRSVGPTNTFLPAAELLANGVRFPLGRYILSSTYHLLQQVSQKLLFGTEDIPSASSADPPHGILQAAPSSQVQEIALKQEQDSPNSLFSFAIDVSDDDGEEASSSLALGTISAEIYAKLEALLDLLQQDTAQLVNDSDPTKAIFKTIRGQIPADIEETLFPAVHLESRQLQYQRAAHRIADRAAQAQLKEEMLQLKQIADEKHKSIGNLQTSGADLKQKILDLSAKRTALLAELKEVEVALTHARQEENQLPDAIKALQQERDIQARKALAMKKKLKLVDGAADEDIKEMKEADQIRLRAISAIQSLLNL
uniref:Aminotransferase-like plant mobile domain-containing protein n=1 Tax=Saccharum hybrid cultivar R570 TaxID=131158 RepID=A0A059PYV0_9POAL|nr:hypothetical protein SHCRBa_014_L10_F_80 [Saccharum hybrid cultivar R570]